ncbi:MAG: NAD-dependent epimerase/dehydratase family protein [Anaerolineaceae bacterium]|nr:NAD-dependent epimerase/dehydratase family protein [Anaerolineaceae bacterium]
MKAFVTGGSGFIGQHVVQKLLARGDEVHALARSAESANLLRRMGATVFMGDITDSASLRPAMAGCDVVFHIAAWYKLGAADWMQAEAINVGGTRRVLRLAHELGIPRIVYTSTIAVFGDTQGQLVDETYYKEGPFLTEYDRTKWLAHYKVALPLIEKGAPIVIVMPGGVYGPGDTSFIAQLMRMFYRGLPALPGSDLTVTYAHVDDIAQGHLLAADKGKVGESYILAGPAIPLNEMVDFWAHLIGRKPPSVRLAGRPLRKFAPFAGAVNSLLPLPSLFSEEAIASLGASYMARSDKARTELGWTTRPLQTGLLETFDWIARTEQENAPAHRERKWAGYALLAAAVLFLLWYLGRKKKK